jgi:redox-regulated HSP33 family molecular chaperone
VDSQHTEYTGYSSADTLQIQADNKQYKQYLGQTDSSVTLSASDEDKIWKAESSEENSRPSLLEPTRSAVEVL